MVAEDEGDDNNNNYYNIDSWKSKSKKSIQDPSFTPITLPETDISKSAKAGRGYVTRWLFQISFIFHPHLGKIIQFD